MAKKKPEKTVKVSPQAGIPAGPRSTAFSDLGAIEAEHDRIRNDFRVALAPVLDQALLTHMSPSQVGDTAQRFVKRVVNRWQNERNVLNMDNVTKAVDQV